MTQQDYSFSSRVLHRLALGTNAVAEMSFDIDQSMHPVTEDAVRDAQHVFVTGLARAGTTILMRQLYRTDAFRSLIYRDMPFVLAPNLWAQMSGSHRKEGEAAERAHGDGIIVDFDSPEALEEVFWRVTSGDSYIRKDHLVPMSIDQEVAQKFRKYVASILKQHSGKRYLSKNNNNILRLKALSKCFPNAVILIPFRDPVQHAYSLMRQHQLFLTRHRDDAFSRNYMTWLVHHEFGQDHRRFVFNGDISSLASTDAVEGDLGYWLQLWVDSYAHVNETAPANSIFISYETLCNHTDRVWPALCDTLGLPEDAPAEDLRQSQKEVEANVSADLVETATRLYNDLSARSLGG